MDKIFSILLLIIVIAIIATGEIYLRIDRNRTVAITLLKRMDLTDWLKTLEAMLAACPAEWSAAYSSLKGRYDAIKPRHILKRVAILNEMQSLARRAVAENTDNTQVIALANKLTDDFMPLSRLQLSYNDCVYKVNRALDGGISRHVGRLFRMERLDKLTDLTVL